MLLFIIKKLNNTYIVNKGSKWVTQEILTAWHSFAIIHCLDGSLFLSRLYIITLSELFLAHNVHLRVEIVSILTSSSILTPPAQLPTGTTHFRRTFYHLYSCLTFPLILPHHTLQQVHRVQLRKTAFKLLGISDSLCPTSTSLSGHRGIFHRGQRSNSAIPNHWHTTPHLKW